MHIFTDDEMGSQVSVMLDMQCTAHDLIELKCSIIEVNVPIREAVHSLQGAQHSRTGDFLYMTVIRYENSRSLRKSIQLAFQFHFVKG